MLIGYQDIGWDDVRVGARQVLKDVSLDSNSLVPYSSAHKLLKALQTQEVDFAVIVACTQPGGLVPETLRALKNCELIRIQSKNIPLTYRLFVPHEALITDLPALVTHPCAQRSLQHRTYTLPCSVSTVVQRQFENTNNAGVLCAKPWRVCPHYFKSEFSLTCFITLWLVARNK